MMRFPRATLGAVAVLVWGCAAAAGPADDGLRRLAAGEGEPLMRVGLDAGGRVVLSSTGSFRVLDPATGEAVWRPSYSGEIAVVAEGAPEGGVASVFRVQAGAFGSREAAETERERLEKRFAVPGVVRRIPDRGSWRVRLGEGATREALGPLVERLRASGLEGLWIVEEPAAPAEDVTLRVVDAHYDSLATGRTRLAIVPGGARHVEVEGTPYRGIIEVRVTSFGTVQAVNWVDLESYLRGVVPAELGPELWPQLEALKAQAVAARTYAWRNRGQFEEQGYDLCATPRCQVYGGVAAEHPMSDRAVAETRGQILTWEGRPISALYTATCGGHTEDAAEIFPEEKAPYLRGVPCRAERDALASMIVRVEGAEISPLAAEDGRDVTRDWVLAAVAGVLGEAPSAREARRPVEAGQLRRWTRNLAVLSGRPLPEGPPGPVSDLGAAAQTLASDLAWTERADVLLDDADLPALLRDPEALRLAPARRRALGYLTLAEGLYPYADGRFHVDAHPSLARLIPCLARIGEAYEAFGLTEAVVAGRSSGGLRLSQGKSEVVLAFRDRPYLFGWIGGRSVPVGRLELWPGDRVRYRTGKDGRIDFLEIVPPVKGTSDDRAAAAYSWEVRKTRRQLEQAVNRRVAVGRLRDLRVLRRGRSGRIVELEVVGSLGSTVVRGFDIRLLLGLRESLTVIEPQRGAGGEIEAVVFAGKGWGHGVGLCQVGAYGMALRGSDYQEILAHYYQGTRLQPLSAVSAGQSVPGGDGR